MWLLQYYGSMVGVANLKEDMLAIGNLMKVLYPEKEVQVGDTIHVQVPVHILLQSSYMCT